MRCKTVEWYCIKIQCIYSLTIFHKIIISEKQNRIIPFFDNVIAVYRIIYLYGSIFKHKDIVRICANQYITIRQGSKHIYSLLEFQFFKPGSIAAVMNTSIIIRQRTRERLKPDSFLFILKD